MLTNLPEERVPVLLSEKELSELPGDSPHISKKRDIDCHSAMENTVFLTIPVVIIFSIYYTLENTSSKTCVYQPDEFYDNRIENNHEECSYPPPPPKEKLH